MGIETYSTVANDNDNAAPNGWPEGMAALDVNNSARQNMADTRTQWNDAEWFEFGDGTPDGPATFVANNQFKIVSLTSVDVTGHWHVGRRVQIINAGTFFATITATSFSVNTTTVTIDSTPLTNTTLTALSSIVSADNSPLPLDQTFDTITASVGIELGGTGSTHLLDDYEEGGTFTPVYVFAAGSGTITYAVQVGLYTKVGDLAHFEITIQATSIASRTGVVTIAGLPFTSNSAVLHSATVGDAASLTITAGESLTAHVEANATTISLRLWDATTGPTQLVSGEVTDDVRITLAGTYIT